MPRSDQSIALNNCLRCTMIKAGCFFSAMISNPITVFPEPGGAVITPKSFLEATSIAVF